MSQQNQIVDENRPLTRRELDSLLIELDLLRSEAAGSIRMYEALAIELESLKNTRGTKQAQNSLIYSSNEGCVCVPELIRQLMSISRLREQRSMIDYALNVSRHKNKDVEAWIQSFGGAAKSGLWSDKVKRETLTFKLRE